MGEKPLLGFRRHYRQRLKDLIEDAGLDYSNFRPAEDDGQTFTLEYRHSGLLFNFSISPNTNDQAIIICSHYNSNRTKTGNANRYVSIDQALKLFYDWLRSDVKPYVDDENTVDPWTELTESFNEVPRSTDKEKFKPREVRALKERLELFPAHLILELQIGKDHQKQFQQELMNELNEIKKQIKKENKGTIRKLIIAAVIETAVKYVADQIRTNLPTLLASIFKFFRTPYAPLLDHWDNLPLT